MDHRSERCVGDGGDDISSLATNTSQEERGLLSAQDRIAI